MDMNVALATVTVVSLAMAFAMGVVTWRLMREERLRSDARVAALMADLERARERDVGEVGRTAPAGRQVSAPVRAARPEPPPHRIVPAASPRRTPEPVRPARPMRPETTPLEPAAVSPTQLFAAVIGSPTLARRGLATAGAAAIVLAAVSLGMLFGRAPAPAGPGTQIPVELLSLAHTRTGEYLAITGSIRNPPAGVERGQLSVTATVFDHSGAVVGSGQTPLPVAVLPPGGETPFTISLPDANRIGRYRISFMQGERNVPHVDRRMPVGEVRSTARAHPGARS